MINKNWIILGLLATLLVTLFFFTCNNPSEPKVKYIPVVKEIEKKVKMDSSFHYAKIDSIKKNEQKWKNKFMQADGDLNLAEKQMTDFLNNADNFIDTSGKEELKLQLDNLKELNTEKDSLYHVAIDARDSLISEKEAKCQAAEEFSSKQRISINELITSNKNADSEIKYLQKQAKKEKAKKKGLKIALIGAIIYGTAQSL